MSHQNTAKQAMLIGIVVFVSYAYFYPGGGWNQNTRFDFVRAIVERGTHNIDAYHENTGDKVLKGGHWYSDKAPGQPLLALPAAVGVHTAIRATGADPLSPRCLVALAYFCTLFSVSLPTPLGSVCLFWIALRMGWSAGAAAFGALAMGLGSPMWAYAILFWAHAPAGACLLFAFAAVLLLDPTKSGRDVWLGFVSGLAAGWATVNGISGRSGFRHCRALCPRTSPGLGLAAPLTRGVRSRRRSPAVRPGADALSTRQLWFCASLQLLIRRSECVSLDEPRISRFAISTHRCCVQIALRVEARLVYRCAGTGHRTRRSVAPLEAPCDTRGWTHRCGGFPVLHALQCILW